jgi:hypothetical protein
MEQKLIPISSPKILRSSSCCHTFRAMGITAYLESGGTIEKAQAIAAHQSVVHWAQGSFTYLADLG